MSLYKKLEPRLVLPYWIDFLMDLGYRLEVGSYDYIWYGHENTLWKVGIRCKHNYNDNTDRVEYFYFTQNIRSFPSYFLPDKLHSITKKIYPKDKDIELSIKALIQPELLPLCMHMPWMQEIIKEKFRG